MGARRVVPTSTVLVEAAVGDEVVELHQARLVGRRRVALPFSRHPRHLDPLLVLLLDKFESFDLLGTYRYETRPVPLEWKIFESLLETLEAVSVREKRQFRATLFVITVKAGNV